MQARHFGDSYDLVKRSLLAILTPLGPWEVHPMFTDRHVDPAFARRFSRLLQRPLIGGTAAFDQSRFMSQCREAGNLLLDPDAGVRLGEPTSGARNQHVYVAELVELAKARPKRLTAVFDQSFPRGNSEREKRLIEKLRALEEAHVSAFAYCSHATFLFTGVSREQTKRARRLLVAAGLPQSRLVSSANPR